MQSEMTCKLLGITLTDEQRKACRYLERNGFTFCVDFGYMNALETARAHWLKRRRARRK